MFPCDGGEQEAAENMSGATAELGGIAEWNGRVSILPDTHFRLWLALRPLHNRFLFPQQFVSVQRGAR